MKAKFLLSLAVALIFPFMIASCGGNKEPKDMTNQELVNAIKKEINQTIDKMQKCKSLEELKEVEASRENELTTLTNELSQRNPSEKEAAEMKAELDEELMKLLEVSFKMYEKLDGNNISEEPEN